LTEPVAPGGLKLYSSDESVVKVLNGQLYPVQAGNATVKAVFANAVDDRGRLRRRLRRREPRSFP